MKSFPFLSFAFSALLALQLIGCDDGPTNPDSSVLWPMQVGNRWIGVREYFDLQGNPVGTVRDTMKIVKSREIDGELWYEFDNGSLRMNRGDGVWGYIPGTADKDYAELIAKYPTTPGDTFSTSAFIATDPSGQPGDSVMIWTGTVSVDSTFTVPYGNVKSHFYSSYLRFLPDPASGRGLDGYAYVPGIGPVFLIGAALGTLSFPNAAYYHWKLEKAELK